jgi:adenosylcobyric acid synthase
MPARTLMIQGTSSSVGKSLLTAGLCRIFARRGLRVAPFKAQNMSNNAAVCADGAEIGRAQAVQAAAAGVEPSADMNPVLLKPEGHSRSQVVVLGRPWQTLAATELQQRKRELWPIVTAALDRLRERFDLVIMEGAGSPVELNLAAGDIVNMAVARHARAPVLLAGDIDRGGIFAQLLGTLWLLAPEERSLVKGLIVNKFRGARSLFDDGVRILEERAGVPVLGVIPYLRDLEIPEEDAVALERPVVKAASFDKDIAVIQLPHIANFDDFDPLNREPGVQLRYVDNPESLGRPDAVILPGTKTTMADLAWMRQRGLDRAVRRLAQMGAAIVGICGGYQMLGQSIRDPGHVESMNSEATGLGLLPVVTEFSPEKATFQVQATILDAPGWMSALTGATFSGYEIHMGRSTGSRRPWLKIRRQGSGRDVVVQVEDGGCDETGRVWGCYLHGLFANDLFRRTWLDSLSPGRAEPGEGPVNRCAPTRPLTGLGSPFEASLERLADSLDQALDMESLERIIADS